MMAGLSNDGKVKRNQCSGDDPRWRWQWRQEDLGFGVPVYIRKQRGCGVQHFDFDVKAEEGVVYLYWGSKLINSNIIIKR